MEDDQWPHDDANVVPQLLLGPALGRWPWAPGYPAANAADFNHCYAEGQLQFVLGQKELTDESWTEYLASLDALGAADYESSAQQALMDAGLLK